MRKLIPYILPFILVCCYTHSPKEDASEKPVAKAGEENLDGTRFRESFVSTGNDKDSAYQAKKFIESWGMESLFYQEALEKLSDKELELDRQVEDYRKSLVNHMYQMRLVDANLDTNISAAAIEAYYDEHRDNFILKENIVKVNYIKVPSKAPGLEKIKKLIHSDKPKDLEQLNILCLQNAESYFMNDSTWLFLDDVKKEMPRLKEEADYNLAQGRVLEFEDELYFYYLKIKDVKVKNGLSPINFERKNIRKFILNSRKAHLISQYKKMLLEKAKASKSFVVY